MSGWFDGKIFSNKFLPEIKSILGTYLIGEAPFIEDAKHNTDLIVLNMEAVRIACRVRRFNYFYNYGSEFTIRKSHSNGSKTELTKIVEGWGDYFFYGFSNEAEDRLYAWTLADLKVFRIGFVRKLTKMDSGQLPGCIKENIDGKTSLIAFKWKDFDESFIIARKLPTSTYLHKESNHGPLATNPPTNP